MSVYVDNVRISASVGRYKDRRWCHLLTDDPSLSELHILAERIGLRRSWFQGVNKQGRPFKWWQCHYDVTEAMRAKAVAAGAVEINFVQWSEMVAKFKEAQR